MSRFTVNEIAEDSSEAEVIRQAKEGDPAAFERLYKKHSRHVYSLCFRMIRNPAEAEDLTQQAFLQVFRKIGTFRGDSGLATWLHRVTVNVVLMHLRRRKPTEILVEDLDSHIVNGELRRELPSEDKSMLDAVDRINLSRALRGLPTGYKTLFLLHDVIELLGCSLGCSKSQLHRARRRLRQLLHGEARQAETSTSPA
jgi:RNA polymerase sigma-70 factor, ECF subfamily